MEAIDIPLGTNGANLAKITLSERYPAQGFAMNTVSEMTVYVLEGSVILQYESSEDEYIAGGAVIVPKGQKYYWKPQPRVTLLVLSVPPWTKEQQVVE